MTTEDSAGSGVSGTATLSWAHTVGSGSAMLLLVSVSCPGNTSFTGATATFTGADAVAHPLTFVTSTTTGSTGSDRQVRLYTLTGPVAGAGTITVTLPSGTPSWVGGSITYSQAGTLRTPGVANTASAGSLAVTTTGGASTDLIFAACNTTSGTAPTLSAPAVLEWAATRGGNYSAGGYQPGGTGTQTTTFNAAAASRIAALAVAVTDISNTPVNISINLTVAANVKAQLTATVNVGVTVTATVDQVPLDPTPKRTRVKVRPWTAADILNAVPPTWDAANVTPVNAVRSFAGKSWKALEQVPRRFAPQGVGDGSPADRALLLSQRRGFADWVTGGNAGHTFTVNATTDTGAAMTVNQDGTATGELRAALRDPAAWWIIFDKTLPVNPVTGFVHVVLTSTLGDIIPLPNKTVDGRGIPIRIMGDGLGSTAISHFGVSSPDGDPTQLSKTQSAYTSGMQNPPSRTYPGGIANCIWAYLDRNGHFISPGPGTRPVGSQFVNQSNHHDAYTVAQHTNATTGWVKGSIQSSAWGARDGADGIWYHHCSVTGATNGLIDATQGAHGGESAVAQSDSVGSIPGAGNWVFDSRGRHIWWGQRKATATTSATPLPSSTTINLADVSQLPASGVLFAKVKTGALTAFAYSSVTPGTPRTRQLTDVTTTNNSVNVDSATAAWTSADVNTPLVMPNVLPDGTLIATVVSGTRVTVTAKAVAGGTNQWATAGGTPGTVNGVTFGSNGTTWTGGNLPAGTPVFYYQTPVQLTGSHSLPLVGASLAYTGDASGWPQDAAGERTEHKRFFYAQVPGVADLVKLTYDHIDVANSQIVGVTSETTTTSYRWAGDGTGYAQLDNSVPANKVNPDLGTVGPGLVWHYLDTRAHLDVWGYTWRHGINNRTAYDLTGATRYRPGDFVTYGPSNWVLECVQDTAVQVPPIDPSGTLWQPTGATTLPASAGGGPVPYHYPPVHNPPSGTLNSGDINKGTPYWAWTNLTDVGGVLKDLNGNTVTFTEIIPRPQLRITIDWCKIGPHIGLWEWEVFGPSGANNEPCNGQADLFGHNPEELLYARAIKVSFWMVWWYGGTDRNPKTQSVQVLKENCLTDRFGMAPFVVLTTAQLNLYGTAGFDKTQIIIKTDGGTVGHQLLDDASYWGQGNVYKSYAANEKHVLSDQLKADGFTSTDWLMVDPAINAMQCENTGYPTGGDPVAAPSWAVEKNPLLLNGATVSLYTDGGADPSSGKFIGPQNPAIAWDPATWTHPDDGHKFTTLYAPWDADEDLMADIMAGAGPVQPWLHVN